MSVYDDIHCLADFGMIAGSYKILYIDCLDDNGAYINLSAASSFGCDFLYYGTGDRVFSIGGSVSGSLTHRMKIEIKSTFTENLGNCCLEYMPYIYTGDDVIKLGKGRIVIEEA